MKYFVPSCSVVVQFLIASVSLPQSAQSPFQLVDLRNLVGLSDPRISPDGSTIAVTVSKSDWEKDKAKQEIDLVSVADGSIRPLTFEREGISNVRWSPDGSRLAFSAKDPESKESQIFVMPMNGGDAIRVTDCKTGVAEFSWSPDGSKIAFVAQDTVPNPKAVEHHEDAFQVTDNNYTVRAPLQPWHVWIVSSKGGEAMRLTSGSWSLETDQESISPLVWTNNGTSIAFQWFPDVWEGNSWHCTITQIDTSGGEIRTVVKDEGAAKPQYSGETLAFMRPRNGDLNNGNGVYVDSRGNISDVTRDLARNFYGFVWLPDGDLLLAGEDGTHATFWRLALNGRAEELNLGDVDANAESATVSKNGAICFLGSTSAHPVELYYLDAITGKPKRLTNLNAFADTLKLGRSESVNWRSTDGFDEDGVLTYPVDYKSGKKYPIVILIHGGPEAASTTSFSPLAQLLSAKGFFVLQPNYRGSTNLGDAYQHAIFRDTGEGPGKDILAGLAKTEETGAIDTSRIGISGWSYGGYMTSWLNGFYPDRWKAAVEGAALNDWVMDYTIAYYQTFDLYFFGSSPWTKESWNIWREQSPIELSRNVKAPTLIMGDAGDPNVPIINSYEMYHALRDNGVHTEFYTYPVDTHFPGGIVRRTDVYKRWVEWMEKYLK
ncbi:MAG TPA: S9 family peptidase [Candidatus Kryptonia bacterium]